MTWECEKQIRDVLHCYCRGVDRLDDALLESVYWPDATDSHGIFSGSAAEFRAWVIPFLREAYGGTLHMLGQSDIRLTGSSATAETYFMAQHWGPPDPDRYFVEHVTGRYLDRFEQRGGCWRIASRVLLMENATRQTGHTGFDLDRSQFIWGSRDHEDPSYQLF